MLTWDWKNKIGTWTENQDGEEITFNIYECNGLAVVLYEFTENDKDMYQMHTFFSDKTHLRNMLGLTKEYNVNYFDNSLVKLELKECKTTKTILNEIIKAEWHTPMQITIIPKCPF